jgi:hypothetical protein
MDELGPQEHLAAGDVGAALVGAALLEHEGGVGLDVGDGGAVGEAQRDVAAAGGEVEEQGVLRDVVARAVVVGRVDVGGERGVAGLEAVAAEDGVDVHEAAEHRRGQGLAQRVGQRGGQGGAVEDEAEAAARRVERGDVEAELVELREAGAQRVGGLEARARDADGEALDLGEVDRRGAEVGEQVVEAEDVLEAAVAELGGVDEHGGELGQRGVGPGEARADGGVEVGGDEEAQQAEPGGRAVGQREALQGREWFGGEVDERRARGVGPAGEELVAEAVAGVGHRVVSWARQ